MRHVKVLTSFSHSLRVTEHGFITNTENLSLARTLFYSFLEIVNGIKLYKSYCRVEIEREYTKTYIVFTWQYFENHTPFEWTNGRLVQLSFMMHG